MSLTTLTSKDLSRAQRLIERKEALAQQVAEIDTELQAIESGAPVWAAQTKPASPAPAPATPPRNRRAGKTVRGQLKGRVISELRSAGKSGVKIRELADRIGTSYGNVTAFFQSTGKKIKQIKKIGPAQYAWVGV